MGLARAGAMAPLGYWLAISPDGGHTQEKSWHYKAELGVAGNQGNAGSTSRGHDYGSHSSTFYELGSDKNGKRIGVRRALRHVHIALSPGRVIVGTSAVMTVRCDGGIVLQDQGGPGTLGARRRARPPEGGGMGPPRYASKRWSAVARKVKVTGSGRDHRSRSHDGGRTRTGGDDTGNPAITALIT